MHFIGIVAAGSGLITSKAIKITVHGHSEGINACLKNFSYAEWDQFPNGF